MVMDPYRILWAVLLLSFSMTIVSSRILRSDSFPEDRSQDMDFLSHSNQDDSYNTDMSLDDIFQHRVEDYSQLCPQKYMLMFLLTRNFQYIKDCGYAIGISKNKTASHGPKPLIATYSGNILKRILDTMDAGTAKVDFTETSKGDSEKRARLSINGALSSLVQMLRHESRRHRRPQYAFHREMLDMG